jgi:binding-protein-dependent transport system inner membrane component
MALLGESEGTGGSMPLQATETGAEPRPLTSGRHHHVSPVALVTRNPSQIKIRSDQLTYHILLGLLDGQHYTHYPAHRLAEYRQVLPKGRGLVNLALSPRSEESWEQTLASLELLGDELVDTFLVLLAVALDTHGTERISTPFAITVDDILALCQKKKSKGSYPVRQRLHVIEQVQILSRVSVRATLVLRDGKQWQVESPLLEILQGEQPEANKSYPGYTDWHPWYLKIGAWASMIPKLQSQTVLMTRQLLHYHARQQKYEKRLGRYLTVLNLPFATWMFEGFFDAIPRELEEAAFVDGSSRFGSLIRIVLPLSGPGTAAVTIFTFLLCYNEFLIANIFLRDPDTMTIPVGIQMFMAQYSTDWGSLMAVASLASIPTIVFFLFVQKYMVQGVVAGAVKG